ncbi:MAG: TonB-dependent receptor [Candidatus Aminicenantes bacterium]|jgi:iron complex outermembrane receptor protein
MNNHLFVLSLVAVLILLIALPFLSAQEQPTHKEKKRPEEPAKITEEILVVAEAPKNLPISTVTRLDSTMFERNRPVDLAEGMKFAPGVYVTVGSKNEYMLNLRGVDSRRIVLLVDGIPVYEPYFSSFDLKTVAAGGIDSIQITKGPSSVLYGPNALGGIVNVITRRPSAGSELSLNASYGEKNTRSLTMDTNHQWGRLGFAGTLQYQDSDGFIYADEESGNTDRMNSDYERTNLNFKLYYTPSDRTEILFNAGLYFSEYGIPPGLDTDRPRYWRFKNWDRYSFNAGGYTALGNRSTLHFRGFYVQYDNTLDAFTDQRMTELDFVSTYDNSVYGLFGLWDFRLVPSNALKTSLSVKRDIARLQDDSDEPWEEYDQGTFSLGIEDHFSFAGKWKLIAGLSLDYLDKFEGENSSKINPLVGIKFSPMDALSFHLSFSRKSKFPSMRSMYSRSSGNPDLLSETGNIGEFGFTYSKDFYWTGSIFFSRFKNLIDSVRLPDRTRRYFNVGEAYINGLEMQLQKSFRWMSATINYTYLDHKNVSDDRPLDVLPNHTLNFDWILFPMVNFRISFLGMLVSSSSWYDFGSDELLDIPSFASLDIAASYRWGAWEPFIKVTNIFDKFYYTEPGYPWRGRYFEFGIRVDVLR